MRGSWRGARRGAHQQAARQEAPVRASVSEESVGIKEFCTTSRPFVGILKQRFADFCVNELQSDGSILRLRSSLAAPPSVKVSSLLAAL